MHSYKSSAWWKSRVAVSNYQFEIATRGHLYIWLGPRVALHYSRLEFELHLSDRLHGITVRV